MWNALEHFENSLLCFENSLPLPGIHRRSLSIHGSALTYGWLKVFYGNAVLKMNRNGIKIMKELAGI